MVIALDLLKHDHQQIVLAGDKTSPDFAALLKAVHQKLLPHVILLHADGAEGQAFLGRTNEALKNMTPVQGKAAAYVCEGFTCQAPVTDPAALLKLL